jgi:hypothetical protein
LVELVRGLPRFSPCELLLLEADNCGTGVVRECRVRRISGVEAVIRQRLVKTRQTEKA